MAYERTVYVIRDKVTGEFLTCTGSWDAEYPEALQFETYREAVNKLRSIHTNPNPIGIETDTTFE